MVSTLIIHETFKNTFRKQEQLNTIFVRKKILNVIVT